MKEMLAYHLPAFFLKGEVSVDKEFLQVVENFKVWAKTADQSFGEWETEYLHWDKIYPAADKLIETALVGEWSGELVEEFLFILAHDNECENIIDTLIHNPNQLISLARYAVIYQDPDARWQFASGLGKINARYEAVGRLLKSFLADEDEYVKRRAALAWEEKGY
jgi:hypothetical protein